MGDKQPIINVYEGLKLKSDNIKRTSSNLGGGVDQLEMITMCIYIYITCWSSHLVGKPSCFIGVSIVFGYVCEDRVKWMKLHCNRQCRLVHIHLSFKL